MRSRPFIYATIIAAIACGTPLFAADSAVPQWTSLTDTANSNPSSQAIDLVAAATLAELKISPEDYIKNVSNNFGLNIAPTSSYRHILLITPDALFSRLNTYRGNLGIENTTLNETQANNFLSLLASSPMLDNVSTKTALNLRAAEFVIANKDAISSAIDYPRQPNEQSLWWLTKFPNASVIPGIDPQVQAAYHAITSPTATFDNEGVTGLQINYTQALIRPAYNFVIGQALAKHISPFTQDRILPFNFLPNVSLANALESANISAIERLALLRGITIHFTPIAHLQYDKAMKLYNNAINGSILANVNGVTSTLNPAGQKIIRIAIRPKARPLSSTDFQAALNSTNFDLTSTQVLALLAAYTALAEKVKSGATIAMETNPSPFLLDASTMGLPTATVKFALEYPSSMGVPGNLTSALRAFEYIASHNADATNFFHISLASDIEDRKQSPKFLEEAQKIGNMYGMTPQSPNATIVKAKMLHRILNDAGIARWKTALTPGDDVHTATKKGRQIVADAQADGTLVTIIRPEYLRHVSSIFNMLKINQLES